MITPQFDVDQDDNYVYVNIRAPYIKAPMIQFEAIGELFVFSLPPYYLRLRFPGNIVNNDDAKTNYDLETSTVKCKIPKETPGEHFADLDMLTKLLATKSQLKKRAIIEEVNSTEVDQEQENDDYDWEIEQEIPVSMTSQVRYGFDNMYEGTVGISNKLEGNEINELEDPEATNEQERHTLLKKATIDAFDMDHYWGDTYFPDAVEDILKFQFPHPLPFPNHLKDLVLRLGKRKYILSSNRKQVYLGLIQLVFGFCYDFRINEGDTIVESAWNIGKICPCMSFLYNSYTNLNDMVVDLSARVLTVPLYRNWNLVLKSWLDTIKVLRGGRKSLLVLLAHLLSIFENEAHRIYREIWIEDYTVWVQYASEDVIKAMTDELENLIQNDFNKTNIYLPIDVTPSEYLKNIDSVDQDWAQNWLAAEKGTLAPSDSDDEL